MNTFLQKIKETIAAHNGQLHGDYKVMEITNIFEFTINGKRFLMMPAGSTTDGAWRLSKQINGRGRELCLTSFDSIIEKKIPFYS